MLGRTVSGLLGDHPRLQVTRTTRGSPGRDELRFDAETDSPRRLLAEAHSDWVVNAIGVIKPLIEEGDPASVAKAMAVNATFPHRLAAAAVAHGARVIQIATDGVFRGADPPYDEDAPHDSVGVYEQSKSRGEVRCRDVLQVRCSIIGPEDPPVRSLLGWVLSQPEGTQITGYADHRWNGVTTLHFAKVCAGVILEDLDLPSPLHLVPADVVSKAELLELALHAYGREDVTVLVERAGTAVDRTLTTRYPDANRRLWRAAGYSAPPTIARMLTELASTGGWPR
jgi:dTDP-4-dehydrorhamnose reductase